VQPRTKIARKSRQSARTLQNTILQNKQQSFKYNHLGVVHGRLAVVSLGLLLASCASSPNNISPTYVSPMVYQNYSCDQIRVELQRIGARVSEVSGQQQRAANNDAVAMGVGLVIFWPALFFLASDNDKREELSRLRGEYDALQQAGTMRNCFAPAAAAAPQP
jgi:hypothetical protein